jgi:hypothetical protein
VHMGLHSMHCDAQSDKRQNKELSQNHKFSWLTLVNTKQIKPLYHIMFKHYTVFWKKQMALFISCWIICCWSCTGVKTVAWWLEIWNCRATLKDSSSCSGNTWLGVVRTQIFGRPLCP